MSHSPRRHPLVCNVEEAEANAQRVGARFGSIGRFLGDATGAKQLGCSWYEIEPGRAAFPRHFHCANEEAAFILEGTGVALIGNDRIEIRAGDFLSFPAGPETPHQLINTGTAPLRLLAISTAHAVEIVGYPDSNKFGATARPTARNPRPWVRELFHEKTGVQYFDGEKADEPLPK